MIAHDFELENWKYQDNLLIKIKKIHDENALKIFDFISSNIFQHAPLAAFDFFRPILNDANISLFLAYYDNMPVGCGVISLVNNIAGLYWGGVLAEYRGRGIGRQLTKYRMNEAKKQGFKNIVAQNLSASVNYYQKIGFKPMGSLPLYLYSGAS